MSSIYELSSSGLRAPVSTRGDERDPESARGPPAAKPPRIPELKILDIRPGAGAGELRVFLPNTAPPPNFIPRKVEGDVNGTSISAAGYPVTF